MKTLIVLAMAFLGLSAAQASVPAVKAPVTQEFFLNSDFDFGKIYFSCNSVENQFTALLKTLGATDIKVNCIGGISESSPMWDASVAVTYTALRASQQTPASTQADFKEIKVNKFDSCFLMTQLFAAVQGSFEMKDLKVTRSCMNADAPFHLQVSTLF